MKRFEPIPTATESVATALIGAAIEVHRTLGPGFLERIYSAALGLELTTRGIEYERECPISVCYRGVSIAGQRVDLIVERRLVVEIKAAPRIDPYHEAQLISYLRATGLRLGLILNFNSTVMRDGIKRIAV